MIYVKCTEKVISLPSESVDIVFTLKAMDDCENVRRMCNEMLRILKPEGTLIGSFNLEEPPTTTEPQGFSEESVKEALLNHLHIESYRLSKERRRR